MSKRRVIIELRYHPKLATAAFAAAATPGTGLTLDAIPTLKTVQMDMSYAPVHLPKVKPLKTDAAAYEFAPAIEVDMAAEAATYLVRGEVDEEKDKEFQKEAKTSNDVVGVFADVKIQPTLVCPGSPALGTHLDVERLLCCDQMRQHGMDGSGVLVAIVDTGINVAYLNAHGKSPNFDAARSWVPQAGLVPGQIGVNHGTMCAFDVCIAAPKCTLLDIAVLASTAQGGTVMEGLLSDAVRGYSHLMQVMTGPRRPGENTSLVATNSWGMFQPSWDYPVGDPRNYSDNPNHPFNRIVASLEWAGADILFAAGNCGSDCPDGRCGAFVNNGIYGANSSPAVLSVAGVDTTRARAGYSTRGPGHLTQKKPDICGYTHFAGSGVYAADGGTSAATPVVAGVVAAVRNKRPYMAADPLSSPAAIRTLITSNAIDLGAVGYDYSYGYGVVDGCTLVKLLNPIQIPRNICDIFPWFCHPIPINICQRYPWLCHGIPHPPFPPIPPIGPDPGPIHVGEEFTKLAGFQTTTKEVEPGGEASPEQLAFLVGYSMGMAKAGSLSGKAPCSCGK